MRLYAVGDLQVEFRIAVEAVSEVPRAVEYLLAALHADLLPEDVQKQHVVIDGMGIADGAAAHVVGGILQVRLSEAYDQSVQLGELRKYLVNLRAEQLLRHRALDVYPSYKGYIFYINCRLCKSIKYFIIQFGLLPLFCCSGFF